MLTCIWKAKFQFICIKNMYSLKYKVTTSTCDSEGRLKLYSALQMMQDCSEMWIDSEPEVKDYFLQQQQCRSLWTQIKSTFCLYICLQKRTRGILRNGGSCVLLVASDKSITLFTCKTRTLFHSSLHRHSLPEQDTG